MIKIFFNKSKAFLGNPISNQLFYISQYGISRNKGKLSLYSNSDSLIKTENKLVIDPIKTRYYYHIESFLKSTEFTEDQIKHFDYFYKTSGSVQVLQKRRIVKSLKKYNVEKILELKLADDFEKIKNFLLLRLHSLKDIDILYCFEKISKLGLFKKFQSEESDLLNKIIDIAAVIKYDSVDTTLRFLYLFEKEEFYPEFMIKQVFKFLLLNMGLKENYDFETILKILDCLKNENISRHLDVKGASEYLGVKFFEENPKFELFRQFVLSVHELDTINNIRISLRVDKYLVETYRNIALGNFIEILYLLVKNDISKLAIYEKLDEIIKASSLTISLNKEGALSLDNFSKLVWSVSQIEAALISPIIWEKIEESVLEFFKSHMDTLNHTFKPFISIILQSFNKANQGSNDFWRISYEKTVFGYMNLSPADYNDIIVIFYNRLKRKIYTPELFRSIVLFEKDLNFSYLPDLDIQKFSLVLYTYTAGVEIYRQHLATDVSDIKTFEDFSIFSINFNKKLNSFFKKFERKELGKIENPDFVNIFSCITLIHEIKDFKITTNNLQLLYNELKYRIKRADFEDILKLSLLFTKIPRTLSVLEETDIIAMIGERLETVLPLEMLDTIIWYLELGIKDEYYWSIFELKVIESIEIYNGNDLISLGIVFEKFGFGSDDFWELMKEAFEGKINTLSPDYLEFAKPFIKQKVSNWIEKYQADVELTEEEAEQREENFLDLRSVMQHLEDNDLYVESLINEIVLK